jgi:hypothetical protein
LANNAQAIRAILLARATAKTLNGCREKLCEPGILLWLQARTFQNGMSSEHKHKPKISFALFGSAQELLFAASRVLSWNKPDPGPQSYDLTGTPSGP